MFRCLRQILPFQLSMGRGVLFSGLFLGSLGAFPLSALADNLSGVDLVILNKITGHVLSVKIPNKRSVYINTLKIESMACYKSPKGKIPEHAAFITVEDLSPTAASKTVFSGWLYRSSPGLNSVEHPLFDVRIGRCVEALERDVPPRFLQPPADPSVGNREEDPLTKPAG